MIEFMILVAFIGALMAGISDLRTTEFPNDIPALMITIGLAYWYFTGLTTSLANFNLSIILGVVFSAAGIIAYKSGLWGDGDAAILGAIGFMIPSLNFLTDFVYNFLIVALLYLLAYAIGLGIVHQKIFEITNQKFGRQIKFHGISFAILFLSTVILNTWVPTYIWMLIFIGAYAFIYLKTVEKFGLLKKVSISKLKIGDVLVSSRLWKGLNEDELKKIKRSQQKFVTIKEGVRFTIVFAITIAATYLFDNLLLSALAILL